MRPAIIPVVVLALALLVPARVLAQQPSPPQAPRPGVPGGDLSPAEVQRLFDAYALVQAQDALKLDEAQYGRFVTAMKNLQETRRRNQQDRMRLLRDLNRLSSPEATAIDDSAITAALDQLKSHDARAASDLQAAYDRLDVVLTPRQQARFRLFEENMERRKIELLMRARQANGGRRLPGA